MHTIRGLAVMKNPILKTYGIFNLGSNNIYLLIKNFQESQLTHFFLNRGENSETQSSSSSYLMKGITSVFVGKVTYRTIILILFMCILMTKNLPTYIQTIVIFDTQLIF